ncbi:hypothetical protein [Aureimonas psammosilenae]|nr:hypothetical protein [Aureimonas psammosilenae]
MSVALFLIPASALSLVAGAGLLRLAKRYWDASLWPTCFDEGR